MPHGEQQGKSILVTPSRLPRAPSLAAAPLAAAPLAALLAAPKASCPC